jgi:hypothetical protein
MKHRLKIFGEYAAGTWTQEKEIETKTKTRQVPIDRAEFDRRKRLATGSEEDRAELRTLPPMETQEEIQEIPFTKTYLIFRADSGAVYCIGRDESKPRREDYPTELFGPWIQPLERARKEGKKPTKGIEFAENSSGQEIGVIKYEDGFWEYVFLSITQAAPAVQSEFERIAGMNIREAVAMFMRTYSDVDKETFQIGYRHMTGQTWTKIQKDTNRSKSFVKDRIDYFYKITGYPRPNRKHGKGKKLQFEDERDLPEHLDTRPARKKRTVSRTVRG